MSRFATNGLPSIHAVRLPLSTFLLPALLTAILASCFATDGARACDPSAMMGDSGSLTGLNMDPVPIDPVPTQPEDKCESYRTLPSPFARHPANPIIPWNVSFCHSFTRDDQGWLSFERLDRGFYLRTSSDGVSWSDSSLAFPMSPASSWFENGNKWFNGFICPDLHAWGEELHLFIDAFPIGGLGLDGKFGHAVSTDRGATWIIREKPLVIRKRNGSLIEKPRVVRMPSIIDRGVDGPSRYVLAYCPAPGNQMVRVAVSSDLETFYNVADNPVATYRDLDWDTQYVARARLVAGDDGTTVHLFYLAQEYVPSPEGRCLHFGHAMSLNGGLDWEYSDIVPVFDVGDEPGWDSDAVIVPALVVMPEANRLRLFYGGFDAARPGHGTPRGIADAFWPFTPYSAPPPFVQRPNPFGRSAVPPASTDEGVIAFPNPFRSGTVIRLDPSSFLEPDGARGGSRMSIAVFDVRGRRTATLWSGARAEVPGAFAWDGRTDEGLPSSPGRYLIEVRVDGELSRALWVTRL